MNQKEYAEQQDAIFANFRAVTELEQEGQLLETFAKMANIALATMLHLNNRVLLERTAKSIFDLSAEFSKTLSKDDAEAARNYYNTLTCSLDATISTAQEVIRAKGHGLRP